MKTIIDNNIFYSIHRKEINIETIDAKDPWVTNSNLDEFARSYNLIYSPEIVRGALRYAMKFCDKNLIGRNPYMYILELDGKKLDLTQHDRYIIGLTEMLAKGFKIIDEEKDDILNNWVKQRETELREIADIFNQWFKNIKKNVVIDKRKLKISEIVEYIKDFLDEEVRNWTKHHFGKEIGISDNFKWEQLDLYLNVFAAFFKSNLVGEGKFKPHDLYDLKQLIYVQPGDKFWTKEKKWQNIIYEKAKKGEYLFEYKEQIEKKSNNELQ